MPNGIAAQITSPERSNSQFIFRVGYDWNEGGSSDIAPAQVYETTPLNVKGSTTPLYVIAESEGNPSGGVCGLELVDQDYPIGQDNVNLLVPSQKQPGITYTFSAIMQPAAYAGDQCYTLAQYQAQPDYPNLMKLFESLQYN